MDLERARFNMIEQQIRPWDVLDQRVLDTIARIPRDAFVPAAYRALAYSDTRIPLGHGQVMMNPNVEARMLQALQVDPGNRVLEIGTGSGYISACLAALGASVDSVEIIGELSERAAQVLPRHATNVQLHIGDAAGGWGEPGSYDVIAVTGSLPAVPTHMRNALTIGGRLFAICGTPAQPIMEAVLITRSADDYWSSDSLFETELPALLNATPTPSFVF